MKFISMDPIGEFHPPSPKGNIYALTVICMHTGFVFVYHLELKVQKMLFKPILTELIVSSEDQKKS